MYITDEQESARLLAAIPPRSPFGARDHALIRFYHLTGVRPSEALGLNVGDVWSRGPVDQLVLRPEICKCNRGRVVPLSPDAQLAVSDLVAFLRMRGFSVLPDAPLLQDRRHRRLPLREVERMVQHYRELAGLGSKPTPHTFRHAFCSRALAAGADVKTVQELAGHVRNETTQTYLHSSPDLKKRAVAGVRVL